MTPDRRITAQGFTTPGVRGLMFWTAVEGNNLGADALMLVVSNPAASQRVVHVHGFCVIPQSGSAANVIIARRNIIGHTGGTVADAFPRLTGQEDALATVKYAGAVIGAPVGDSPVILSADVASLTYRRTLALVGVDLRPGEAFELYGSTSFVTPTIRVVWTEDESDA